MARRQNQQHFVVIQICSNCTQHQWCTRHDEKRYEVNAISLKNQLLASNHNVNIDIKKQAGYKLGAFQVIVNGLKFFSKLDRGYFPQPSLVASRIIQYFNDLADGKDVSKYHQQAELAQYSQLFRQASSKSPTRREPRRKDNDKFGEMIDSKLSPKRVVEEDTKKEEKKPEEKKQPAPVQVKKEKVEDIPQKPVESSSKPPEEKVIEKQPEPEKKAGDPEPAKLPQNQQSSTAQPEEKKEEPKVETKEQPPVQKQPESKEEPKPDVETPPPVVQETKVPKEQEPIKIPQVAPEDPKATVNEAPKANINQQKVKEDNTENMKYQEDALA